LGSEGRAFPSFEKEKCGGRKVWRRRRRVIEARP